jgi:RNA polymerase sigma-70 factor (ECF subfamily)
MEIGATVPGGSAEPASNRLQRSEQDLIERAKNGSREAADELVNRYWNDAFKGAFLILGNHEDAEDVTQEAFVAALGSMRRFRRSKPFQPWLRRIVANKALDTIRSNKRRRRRDLEIAAQPGAAAAASISDLGVTDPALAKAVVALPLEQRLVVVLRTVFGMQTVEIAKILKTPRGTVASRLHRGLSRLRTTYGGNDGQ